MGKTGVGEGNRGDKRKAAEQGEGGALGEENATSGTFVERWRSHIGEGPAQKRQALMGVGRGESRGQDCKGNFGDAGLTNADQYVSLPTIVGKRAHVSKEKARESQEEEEVLRGLGVHLKLDYPLHGGAVKPRMKRMTTCPDRKSGVVQEEEEGAALGFRPMRAVGSRPCTANEPQGGVQLTHHATAGAAEATAAASAVAAVAAGAEARAGPHRPASPLHCTGRFPGYSPASPGVLPAGRRWEDQRPAPKRGAAGLVAKAASPVALQGLQLFELFCSGSGNRSGGAAASPSSAPHGAMPPAGGQARGFSGSGGGGGGGVTTVMGGGRGVVGSRPGMQEGGLSVGYAPYGNAAGVEDGAWLSSRAERDPSLSRGRPRTKALARRDGF